MKKVTLTFIFDITEEGLKTNDFKDFENEVLNGSLQKELNTPNENKMGVSNCTVTLDVK